MLRHAPLAPAQVVVTIPIVALVVLAGIYLWKKKPWQKKE